jgi:hypothetical protein
MCGGVVGVEAGGWNRWLLRAANPKLALRLPKPHATTPYHSPPQPTPSTTDITPQPVVHVPAPQIRPSLLLLYGTLTTHLYATQPHCLGGQAVSGVADCLRNTTSIYHTMDAAAASVSSTFAGSSTEASTPTAFEDDARHYATTASQVPKPASTSMLPPLPSPNPPPDAAKDVKNIGTRFHEDCHETDSPSPRLRSSRVWKGKGKETLTVEREPKKPKSLLDLPLDILKEIVREVTHTNDLTSLALCHSALHQLTVPHIYSRFDIVWPDSSTHAEPRSGVDALTYGLSTLVMAEEVFGEAPGQRKEGLSNRFAATGHGIANERAIRQRRGNHYAHFTKKFSLGNGPADWVQEYLISKEGGKMLGTLVALAVARMRSLETFVWDMPTGILRDVWLALSSLADRADGEPCRLDKVWVRWHDNSSADHPHAMPPGYVTAPPPPLQYQGNFANPGIPPHIRLADLDRVEHPSFSVLPAMRSLSVLDIDELAYLDEMAVLIGRSVNKLRELRIGLARHAMTRDWVTVWEGDNLHQVDRENPTAGFITIGEKRLGGVLGTLMGFVHDMRPRRVLPIRTRRPSPPRPELRVESPALTVTSNTPLSPTNHDIMTTPDVLHSPPPISSPHLSPPNVGTAFDSDPLIASSRCASPRPFSSDGLPVLLETTSSEPTVVPEVLSEAEDPVDDHVQNALRLEVLELERVPLSIPVLQRAIEWSTLTSLTILHCQNHEALWKTLRRSFAPTPKSPMYPTPRRTTHSSPRKGGKQSGTSSDVEMQYHLNLKRVHTNTVSLALINFLKETLAPDSLEVLFLQEGRTYASTVTVEQIYRGPLRRHRQSLKKVLIDSSEKAPDGHPTSSSRWRRWMLTRDILAFICSGKMTSLRELGMALDYHDWVRLLPRFLFFRIH